MRLVFIIDNGKVTGGGDYAQFKFAESLAKRGHDVTVFAANYNSFMKEMKRLSTLNIHIRKEIPRLFRGVGRLNGIWYSIYSQLIIEPYMRKHDVDYIIGYLRQSAIKVVKIGKKHNIRIVNFVFESPPWMEHALGERWLNEYKGRFKKSWQRTKKAYEESDVLICNSKLSAQWCSKWLNKKVKDFVYPGIEMDLADTVSAKKKNQIIYIGRLNEYKNVDTLISALSMISNPPRLVVIGGGEEEAKLKGLASHLRVPVIFKGSINDLEKFKEIKKSLFMVFPSSFEGFGMPPMEALYCNIPCICTDLPIFREIYGNKVEYFKENDKTDLKNKIEFILNDKKYREKRGESGREYILEKYNWDISAEKIEKILLSYKRK